MLTPVRAAAVQKMSDFLGIDTSNYTTSAAIYISEENRIVQAKKLLPVKDGELGLRQSDAVFHHTVQLPEIVESLCESCIPGDIKAAAASARPRNAQGSYMPCFLCGSGFVRSFGALRNIPVYETSHQVGHVLAALYSADRLDLVNEPFIAFHASGGTTDSFYCEPDGELILRQQEIGCSLDLKAGQAVDRVGVMLGLKFPCGAELEKLAVKADRTFKVKVVIKDGSCCMSGIENKCRVMLKNGEKPENIARYCLDFIAETVAAMTRYDIDKYGDIPVIFAGGVMSDTIIRERLSQEFSGAAFAEPAFSCDNAAGIAIFGYLKYKGEK